MSWLRLVWRSLIHHGRMNIAVAMGVAAASAVLIGALIVGDSVRASLRGLALDRLGEIDELLLTDRFFRTELAKELAADPGFKRYYSTAVPLLLFPQGTVEKTSGSAIARATNVMILGCGEDFWELGDPAARPETLPATGEIVLNAALADELDARPGDRMLLRLPRANQVPADSPLGEKADRIRSVTELRVVAIAADRSLGRFSLTPSQTATRNAYVHPQTLQDALDQTGRVNSLLVAGDGDAQPQAHEQLTAALRPTLADYGIRIHRVRRLFHPADDGDEEIVYDYFQITSDRMVFEPQAEAAIPRALARGGQAEQDSRSQLQAVSTYIANSIRKQSSPSDAEIPYSVVTGVDSVPQLGPLQDQTGRPLEPLGDDEIVLNSWAAEDLEAQVGDRILLRFYQPETAHTQLVEQTAEFVLRAIVPLTEPAEPYSRRRPAVYDRRPTLANDPDLTPLVEGLTDQESIDDWEAPFPVDYSRVRSQDDDYWQNHRTTPKAFVSLATAKRLWGSRFGSVTAFRLAAPSGLPPGSEVERQYLAELSQRMAAELQRVKGELEFAFQPIRRSSEQAAAGTTPFDVLFLALSFFVIAAALILVALLFRLAVEQRAAETGTLLAVGFPRRRVAGVLIAEAALVASLGSAAGILLGSGYAWLMIAGLRTWWLGAITTPFLELHVTPASVAIGYAAGLAVSAATIAVSLLFLRRVPVRSLLAGRASGDRMGPRRAGRWWWLSLSLLAISIALAVAAARSGGQTQAAAFVGAGTAVLAALLVAVSGYLRAGAGLGVASGRSRTPRRPEKIPGQSEPGEKSGEPQRSPGAELSLAGLAARNAARNPSRSTMTIALMAVASFLIMAMGAFRAEPASEGTGGFALIARSDRPLFEDLNRPAARELLLGEDTPALARSFVASLRVHSGDDASCTNLYRPSQPQILGLPEALVQHFDRPEAASFGWSGSAARTPQQQANPWHLLDDQPPDDDAVPVILDANTAMYSLQLYGGVGERFELQYAGGQRIRFRVVGLLKTCILQGSLLIGEPQFVKLFPEAAGYRMFLIAASEEDRQPIAELLESRLSDQGFDAIRSEDRLRELLAVQNTYLSTFQTLGMLGLLLGTFGLGTVQVRNVVERRSELALMRAAGFPRRRLASMVMWENVGLLAAGLLSGFAAAMVAVLPHVYLGGATLPLRDLLLMLGSVLVAGVLSSLASVRSTLRSPLLPALRGD